MTTIEFLAKIAKILSIEHFRLVRFGEWLSLQDYLADIESNDDVLNMSSELSSETGIPFWDATLLCVSKTMYSDYNDIVDNANHHNPIINDNWIEGNSLDNSNLSNSPNIGINSLVRTKSGELYHIPMLDFHLPVNDRNTQIVNRICVLMGCAKGAIINSGNSYHFIGCELLTENELVSFLAKGLLYGPITDTRWIAHQIIERSCTLRVGIKNNAIPYVILSKL